jgi:selenide,water dikinase
MHRRKAIMARSIKLGHCVCNPKIPCPCPAFQEFNVCTCAGERLPVKTKDAALTKFIKKAGCASKIGQADLKRILGQLPPVTDSRVLVGAAAGDDAGVFRMEDKTCLVQTVDVFTPCVDDPYLFGKIAAANSVSDIYAMGGRPLCALSIIGFPIEELDGSIMEQILKGGIEKLNEVDCPVIGGHSINDEEVKCGFAITGSIDPNRIISNKGARHGDDLVLTKPLGTGMIAFAAQIGRISPECLDHAGRSMATLNKDAAELMIRYEAHACTDITGFGLAGHLVEMIRTSGMNAEIDMSALPVFSAVKDCLENEILPGAIERNQEYSMAWVEAPDEGELSHVPILYDPQTSGGLLISLPSEKSPVFVKEMRDRGHSATTIMGRIRKIGKDRKEERIILTNTRLKNFIGPENKRTSIAIKEECMSRKSEKPEPQEKGGQKYSCCSSPAKSESDNSKTPLQSSQLFASFMKEANKPGLVDQRSKKLIAIALSISGHCRQCLVIHMKGALEMGISRAEIDEAAWMAISFCGSPAMMFYRDVCGEVGMEQVTPKIMGE